MGGKFEATQKIKKLCVTNIKKGKPSISSLGSGGCTEESENNGVVLARFGTSAVWSFILNPRSRKIQPLTP